MAAKKKQRKKKALTKKQRILAAKKGWETRRAKERNQRLIEANPELEGVEEEFKEAVRLEVERQLPEIRSQVMKDVIRTYVEEGKIENDVESIIYARLIAANKDGRFYDEVLELAEDFPEYSVREIYTMGESPK